MAADEPPYLTVGTDVSAKYKGAFCEAKIKKVNRFVKCKVTFKNNQGSALVPDEQIQGTLRVGAHVEAKHPDKNQMLEAVINKLLDYSQYTVVFDDGDETTLRRTSLCLKSGRHFAESESLDQLPLTNPEHFSTPVIGSTSRRKRRSVVCSAAIDDDSSDDDVPPPKTPKIRRQTSTTSSTDKNVDWGRVVYVDMGNDRRASKKESWFPALIVSPSCQENTKLKDEHLVRSFKDGRYYQVAKKETKEFTKGMSAKIDSTALRLAVEKAYSYMEKDELPAHWDRDILMGTNQPSGEEDTQSESDTSDDEPSEEKDRFVAQLYKFMDERGTPINRAPCVGNRDLNLYKLFKIVQKIGGYNRVTNQNQWKSVFMRMGLQNYNTASSHQTKLAYKKYLHSFEDFFRKLGCTMVSNTRSSRGRHRSDRNLIMTRNRERDFSHTRGSKALLAVKEKPQKKESNKTDDKDDEKTRRTGRTGAAASVIVAPKEDTEITKELSQTAQSTTEIVDKKETRLSKGVPDVSQPSSSVSIEEKIKNTKKDTPASKKRIPFFKEDETDDENNCADLNSDDEDEDSLSKLKDKNAVKRKDAAAAREEKKTKKVEDVVPVSTASVNLMIATASTSKEAKSPVKSSPEKKTKKSDGVAKKIDKEPRREKRICDSDGDAGALSDGEMIGSKPPSLSRMKSEDFDEMGKKMRDDEKRESGGPRKPKKRKLGDGPDGDGNGNDYGQVTDVEEFMQRTGGISVSDKIRVKYGNKGQHKIYEAKVLKVDDKLDKPYYVHYTGWNMRYDEWIRRSRIVENVTGSAANRKKKLNSASKAGSLSKSSAKRGRPSLHSIPSNSSSSSSSSPVSSTLKESRKTPQPSSSPLSASRPCRTRSDKSSLCLGLEPRKRIRRKSGAASDIRDSDIDESIQSDNDENSEGKSIENSDIMLQDDDLDEPNKLEDEDEPMMRRQTLADIKLETDDMSKEVESDDDQAMLMRNEDDNKDPLPIKIEEILDMISPLSEDDLPKSFAPHLDLSTPLMRMDPNVSTTELSLSTRANILEIEEHKLHETPSVKIEQLEVKPAGKQLSIGNPIGNPILSDHILRTSMIDEDTESEDEVLSKFCVSRENKHEPVSSRRSSFENIHQIKEEVQELVEVKESFRSSSSIIMQSNAVSVIESNISSGHHSSILLSTPKIEPIIDAIEMKEESNSNDVCAIAISASLISSSQMSSTSTSSSIFSQNSNNFEFKNEFSSCDSKLKCSEEDKMSDTDVDEKPEEREYVKKIELESNSDIDDDNNSHRWIDELPKEKDKQPQKIEDEEIDEDEQVNDTTDGFKSKNDNAVAAAATTTPVTTVSKKETKKKRKVTKQDLSELKVKPKKKKTADNSEENLKIKKPKKKVKKKTDNCDLSDETSSNNNNNNNNISKKQSTIVAVEKESVIVTSPSVVEKKKKERKKKEDKKSLKSTEVVPNSPEPAKSDSNIKKEKKKTKKNKEKIILIEKKTEAIANEKKIRKKKKNQTAPFVGTVSPVTAGTSNDTSPIISAVEIDSKSIKTSSGSAADSSERIKTTKKKKRKIKSKETIVSSNDDEPTTPTPSSSSSQTDEKLKETKEQNVTKKERKIKQEIIPPLAVEEEHLKEEIVDQREAKKDEPVVTVQYEEILPDDKDMAFLLCEEKVPASPVPADLNNEKDEETVIESKLSCFAKITASLMPNSNIISQSTMPTTTTSMASVVETAQTFTHFGTSNSSSILASSGSGLTQHRDLNIRLDTEVSVVLDNTPPTTPESSGSLLSSTPPHEEERPEFKIATAITGLPTTRNASESEDTSSRSTDGSLSTTSSLIGSMTNTHTPLANETLELSVQPKTAYLTKRPKIDVDRHFESSSSKRLNRSSRFENTLSKTKAISSGRQQKACSESSDSDEQSNCSAPTSISMTTAIISVSSSMTNAGTTIPHLTSLQNRPTNNRPSKFNFDDPLDDYTDASKRISVLQDRLSELRKTYMALKAEVALIDRRRKKAKKKERDNNGNKGNTGGTTSATLTGSNHGTENSASALSQLMEVQVF